MNVPRIVRAATRTAVVAALLAPAASSAQTAPAAPAAHAAHAAGLEHSIALEFGDVAYLDAAPGPNGWSLGLAYRLHFPQQFGITLGGRWLFDRFLPGGNGVEGYAGVALEPDFGVWRPTVGLEMGLSSLTTVAYTQGHFAPGSAYTTWSNNAPFYLAVTAEPLRWRVGHFTFGTLAGAVGTTLPDAGRALRLQLTLARVEWRF